MGRVNKTRQKYGISLVSEVLGYPGVEEERTFDFLRGDPTPKRPRGTPLPVDAYYPDLRLVLEFGEAQHYSNGRRYQWWNQRITATGERRQEQRARYDQKREEVLPKHNMKLLVIRDDELPGPRARDILVISKKLEDLGFT